MATVPRTSTPITAQQAAGLLVKAFARRGAVLTRGALSLLLSQLWLETGRGKNAFNNNWGNLSASSSWEGDRWAAPWANLAEVEALMPGPKQDRYRALHQDALAGRQPSAFRAYRTPEDGMADYADLLMRPRYSALLYAALTGDPATFTAAIQSTGYAPAIDVAATTSTIAALQRELLPYVDAVVPIPTSVSPATKGAVAFSLAAAAAAVYWLVGRS